MARYIDATQLQAKILDASITNKLPESKEVLKIFDKMVQSMPTADVAPKSEVALDVIRKVKNKVKKYKHNVVNPYEHIILYLNELEKKYTEEKK